MINNDQLREITAIIDRLEQSRFGYLDLKLGDLHVTIGTSHPGTGAVAPAAAAAFVSAPAAAGSAAAPSVAPPPALPAQAETRTTQAATPSSVSSGKPVPAPMVGRYYARPEPGAEPYVKVGDVIQADTTVGLVEVMKVFNAVTAGVAGRVTHIAVADGDFVEFDQTLMYVEAIES